MVALISHIFFSILFILLALPVIYFFVLAIAAKFRKPLRFARVNAHVSIAILIPAYREDLVIIDTCLNIINQDYPADRFQLFVAAHQLKDETISELQKLPIKLYIIESQHGSKALSLQTILNNPDVSSFELSLILDADNHLLPGVLYDINAAYQHGARAIQLHRSAKNSNAGITYLEAISEEINNILFREGQRALGLSASTIGSGMAFTTQKLKEIYNLPGIIYNPACDRVVDFEIMKAGIRIEYLNSTYVLDEKVSSVQVFRQQRTRWLESQLIHIKLFLHSDGELNYRSINTWNKFFSNLIPPRLLIAATLILADLFFLIPAIKNFITPPYFFWIALTALYLITLIIAIPGSYYDSRLFKSVIHLPAALFNFILAFLKINSKRTEFLHTPKTFKKNP